MYQASPERLAELRAQEEELVFPRFDLDDAWAVGTLIVERARANNLGVTVDIRRGENIVFRAALPGSNPDQQYWIEGKTATASRLGRATLLLSAEFSADGVNPSEMGWLPRDTYILDGGCVPVRVAGVGVVALVTVSGLPQSDDHDLAVWGLREHLGALSKK